MASVAASFLKRLLTIMEGKIQGIFKSFTKSYSKKFSYGYFVKNKSPVLSGVI